MRAASERAAAWILVAGVVAGPTACATPVTGKHEIALVSESQEIQMCSSMPSRSSARWGCTTTRKSRITSRDWA
jgi:hypothetical protein